VKCWICNKGFKDDEPVIPIAPYVVNEKRGDFVGQATNYAHASHLRDVQKSRFDVVRESHARAMRESGHSPWLETGYAADGSVTTLRNPVTGEVVSR
jgi:cytosine/adenosine deaminase-related metal-dependent hydrolase